MPKTLLLVLVLALLAGCQASPVSPTAVAPSPAPLDATATDAPQPTAQPTAVTPSVEPSPGLSPLPTPALQDSPLALPTVEKTSKGGDVVKDLEAAVLADIERRVTEYTGAGLDSSETTKLEMYADGRSGAWQGSIRLAACPIFTYPASYEGAHNGKAWELYETDESMYILARAWATAYSASHDAEPTMVPGADTARELTAVPELMIEIMQGVLDEPDNAALQAVAGFYLCQTDKDGFGTLSEDALSRLKALIPEVREHLAAQ